MNDWSPSSNVPVEFGVLGCDDMMVDVFTECLESPLMVLAVDRNELVFFVTDTSSISLVDFCLRNFERMVLRSEIRRSALFDDEPRRGPWLTLRDAESCGSDRERSTNPPRFSSIRLSRSPRNAIREETGRQRTLFLDHLRWIRSSSSTERSDVKDSRTSFDRYRDARP